LELKNSLPHLDHDPIFARILHVLARQGPIPNQQLVAAVGLSQSACQRLVQDPKNRGVIHGHRPLCA
jgi:Lrp/AsnC family leucine-responsive transcriptional regulator